MDDKQVVLGHEALLKAFENLKKAEQKKIVRQSLVEASKPLRSDAKRAWQSATKKKQKGYAAYFKTKVGKRSPIAVTGIAYYKARWINWGTVDRYTGGRGKKKQRRAFRGKIEPTYFFSNVFTSHSDSTIEKAAELLVDALEKIAGEQMISA